MPIKQNAKKALRQNKKRAAQNLVYRVAYKEAVKAVKKAVALGKDAKEMLRLAQKKMDKAAKVGIIKKNTASRKLSRLTKMTKKVAK
ncbi:MAG: 30S ribosomal protein S20 [Candidatus Magasanikbacteria bacterium GW2011_GWC2_37_14]|uniref:Small ribosomal subunit protein bS20 n=1 Tax=Candidatus Magasanikbacteria bacterium GW2011_GWC2_37_14 TaxID=1619046 RepID=A0A0G0GBZ3_9BACT|nr:MAG: 30S ribosomal protein S20 [Candidatus Magasanikbacteria bacterium GW2011_GWC2_37_14]